MSPVGLYDAITASMLAQGLTGHNGLCGTLDLLDEE